VNHARTGSPAAPARREDRPHAAPDPAGAPARPYVPERKGNPFVRSAAGGRLLSASQLPWFTTLPPRGFGVLTTIGRRTGKTRRKCVRAIRRGDKAFVVSIGGARAAWLKNIRANPPVRLRIRGGTFAGVARELRNAAEAHEARVAYCETVNPFDYAECVMHRSGLPARVKIEELHRTWFDRGIPLVVDLPANG
jgi:deazaflavin-dependent oxidoreductase (nitroreductase family)